ncbi:MAG: HAMP domain-containing protein [Gammaproteobacteria bacterium]|nr:HAMP domain-containing protein [Gammaproteobacteria bacterium]
MKFGLRLKLALPMVILWIGLFAGFEYYWLPSFLQENITRYTTEQEQKVHLLLNGLVESGLRDDLANIYSTLNLVLKEHEDWLILTLRDTDKNLLYPLDQPPEIDKEPLIRISHEHKYSGTTLFFVDLVTDPWKIFQEQDKLISELHWLFLTMLFVALTGSMLLEGRLVCLPIQELARAAKRVSDRDFNARLPTARNDEVGELIISFALMRSDIQLYQDEILQARDEALKATRVKSEFLANMSHELRTPLNAILGYSELIEDDLFEQNSTKHLPDIQKIQCAGNHLLSLINDILDLSKIEAGKMELQVCTFSLQELINEVTATIQPLAEKNGDTLKVNVSHEVNIVNTDKTKLRQVLFNLLSNACKFTSQGLIQISVNASSLGQTDCFIISIHDTGIGIPQDKIASLFDAFTQVDSAYNRKYQGTGLGLALSRKLSQLMGGDITVTSQVNSGSTFTLTLPSNLAKQQAA